MANLKNIEIGLKLRGNLGWEVTSLLTGPHLTSFVGLSNFVELRTIAVLVNVTGQIENDEMYFSRSAFWFFNFISVHAGPAYKSHTVELYSHPEDHTTQNIELLLFVTKVNNQSLKNKLMWDGKETKYEKGIMPYIRAETCKC